MFTSLDWLLGLPVLGFMPHGHCYLWRPDLLAANVISDGLIFGAYVAISAALWDVARKRRDLLEHPRTYLLFVLFGVFILACGLTHLVEVWTTWYPDYWLSAFVKVVTAVASVGTAWLLWRFVPVALTLPSGKELGDLSTHLQVVREDEKRAIAKRLHDELGSGLTVVSIDLYNVHKKLQEERNPLATNLGMAIRLLNSVIDTKRSVVEDLRPTILHELGVVEALEQLARRFTARTGIGCTIQTRGDVTIGEELGITLFRIAQESIDNVIEHARARNVTIVLERMGPKVQLSILDDGQGGAMTEGSRLTGYGWRNCRQLLARWRGTFQVRSGPGGGTLVTATAQEG